MRHVLSPDTAMRRFGAIHPNPETMWIPAANHPAVAEGRTLFPTTVVASDVSPRLLIDGHNSRKIGRRVTKGRWKGMRIFTLTLEERATCPRSCDHWNSCYGNAMPFARRHRADADLIPLLEKELAAFQRHYRRRGFVVRLHVLGDFFSEQYATTWLRWLDQFPALHVFGYTARDRSDPIGKAVRRMNFLYRDRCVIRFSGIDTDVVHAEPTWSRQGNRLVCPAQTGKTDCCATCGLCWAPEMRSTRIVFIAHGPKLIGRRKKVVA